MLRIKRRLWVLVAVFALLIPAAPAIAADEWISLDVHGVALADVLHIIALQAGANIVTDESLNGLHVTTRLEHLRFAQALSVLAHAYGLVVTHENNVIVATTAAALRKRNDDLAIDDDQVTIVHLRYARAADAAKKIGSFLPERSYSADPAQNSILLIGRGPMVTRAYKALRAMDVKNQQVRFEVKVIDVALNNTSNIGVLFGADANSTGTTATAFRTADIPLTATLNALITQGRAKVLATPRIVTSNNTEATLLVGESYPLVTTTVASGAAVQQVQYMPVGVQLRVTPTIGSDGSILADIHPQYSGFEANSVQGYPIITNRQIDATLRVDNDESIVLAGLLDDVDQETITKVPLLGDLPVLGPVFRNRLHSHSRDEVIFIITPHVL